MDDEGEPVPSPSPVPPVPSPPPPPQEEEEEASSSMLHCLRDTEDAIEDATAHQPQQDPDEAPDKEEDGEDANVVGRPAPSLRKLLLSFLDRSTGLLSTLQVNTNREAGPLDLALLRASRRPPWTLFVDEDAASPTIVVAQERALLLRRGPEYARASQVRLQLPPEEPVFQPGCWTVAFAGSGNKGGWVAVAGWSGAVYVFSTSAASTTTTTLTPALTIPTPSSRPDPHQLPPEESGLVAALAWRGSTELLLLRYSGLFSRLTLRARPNAPESLELVGGKQPSSSSMDLQAWHRGGCSALAYDPASNRVVVAGGSLRTEQASILTVWKCAPAGDAGPPLTIEHELSVGVGFPLLLKPPEVRRQQAGFIKWWFGGVALASLMDSKIPVQCPVLHLSLSPAGGKLLVALDVEGGLSLFALRGDDAWGALGTRMLSLPLGNPAAGKSVSIAEVAWWSATALAVLDKKGHAHVMAVEEAEGVEGVRFRPLLSTDLPIGRGASLACPGDDQRLLVLQCYVGLRGRLRGKLVRLERQTPQEAMLGFGKSGQVLEALEVAAQHQLDTDPMFKALWVAGREKTGKAPHTVQDVQRVLAQVQDTAWVLAQVLADAEADAGDCAALDAACKLALARTEYLGNLGTTHTAADASLCLYRLKVLEVRDRVKTYHALYLEGGEGKQMSHTIVAASSWAAFRRRPLREVAEDVASEGNVRGLLHLICNHPLILGPADVADLLCLLPETLSPSSYQQLLPGLPSSKGGGSGSKSPGRQAASSSFLQYITPRALDWVEQGKVPAEWEEYWTPQSLEAWYVARVEQVEARGGALGAVVSELVNIGLSRGVPEGGALSQLRAELWHLTRLVYAGLLGGPSEPKVMTLANWQTWPVRAIMRRVLEQVPLAYMEDPPALVQTIETYLLPMVRGQVALRHPAGTAGDGDVEKVLAEEVTDLLVARILEAREQRTALQKEVAADQYQSEAAEEKQEALQEAEIQAEVLLQAAVAVAQDSKPNLPEDRRLLRRDADLFRLVLGCCRAHDTCLEPEGTIDLLWSLIECLPVASDAAPNELQADVDALEARMTAAQYLSNYTVTLPLSVYERFQSEAMTLPALTPWQTDFRALAGWESMLSLSIKNPTAGAGDDGASACDTKTRLDLCVVARMAKHLAMQGAEALQGVGGFWNEVGEDLRSLQAGGIFRTVPLTPWAQALLYSALKGVTSCSAATGSPTRRLPAPPPPPSKALLSSAMAGLQLPAAAVEEVVIRLLQEWLQEAEGGLEPPVVKARALVAAMPFSSAACAREARWLEAVQLAAKLAGDKGVGKEDLTPLEVRAAAAGRYGMQTLAAVLATRPKLVLTEDGETDLLQLAGLLGLEEAAVEGRLKLDMIKKALEIKQWEMAGVRLLQNLPVPKPQGAVGRQEESGTKEEEEEEVWDMVLLLLTGEASAKALPVDLYNSLLHRALTTAPPTQLPHFVRLATEKVLTAVVPSLSSSQHQKTLQTLALEDYQRALRGGGEEGKELSPQRKQARDDALLGLVQEAMGKARQGLVACSKKGGRGGGGGGKTPPRTSSPPAVQDAVERALIYLLGLSDGRRGVEWVREAVAAAEGKAQEEAAETGRRAQVEGETRVAQAGAGASVDEGAIVKQLLARGYSKNGAIRAARAVGNKSADKAIQWAIQHSHDPGFDDPLPAVGASLSSSPPPPASPFAFPRPSSPFRTKSEPVVEEGEGGGVEGTLLELLRKLAIRYLCLEAVVVVKAGQAEATTWYSATADDLLKRTMMLPDPPLQDDSFPALCRREVAAYSQEAGRTGLITTLQAFVPHNLDAGRLRVDESYRSQAVLAAARRDDAQAWTAAVSAAGAWQVDVWELAMAHVEYWFKGPLKEVWGRHQAAGLTDAIARFESVALGKKGTPGGAASGSATEQDVPASSSSLTGCAAGSPAALLTATGSPRAKEALERLAALWQGLEGKALPLLELLGRLMADVAGVAEASEGGGVTGASKRLKDHVQLLRRLVRVPGLVPLVDYKVLTGATHPFRKEEGEGTTTTTAVLLQQAYRELVRVVRRDNVSALSKLATRILPAGGVTASTVNRAYVEALLRGLDPLLTEEEANLPLARADAHERFAHRVFVAEPYLERLSPVDVGELVEGMCLPTSSSLLTVGSCLSSVADRLALVHKVTSQLKQQQQGAGAAAAATHALVQRVGGLLEALMMVGGEKTEEGRALEAAWVAHTAVGPLLETMLLEGRGGGWAGMEALVSALAAASSAAGEGGGGVTLPEDGALGVLTGAITRLLAAPTPFSKAHLKKVEGLLKATVVPAGDEGANAHWAKVLPVLETYVGKEEGEAVISGGARADVIEIVLGLGRDLGIAGGGEATVEYHRAAEMLWEGLGRKLSRAEASTVEGRVQALLEAVEGPKGLEKTGAETALALVRLWGGDKAGNGPLGLVVDWSRWVVGEPLQTEEATTTAPEYDAVYRRLTERALEAGKWNGAASLLLWSPWRFRATRNVSEEEPALAEKLESLKAPLGLRYKVSLSSPHVPLRQEAMATLPALLGNTPTGSTGDTGGATSPPLILARGLSASSPRILSAPILAADETLLALITAALFPPNSHDDPLPFVISPAWRVLADALLLLPAHPKASQPPPLPATVAFVAARLVVGQAHLQAGALLAEARQLHPSLRTVEGVLSLLWATLCARTHHANSDEEEELVDQPEDPLWVRVREAAKAVLEADETD